jgi:hypothetical protein
MMPEITGFILVVLENYSQNDYLNGHAVKTVSHWFTP